MKILSFICIGIIIGIAVFYIGFLFSKKHKHEWNYLEDITDMIKLRDEHLKIQNSKHMIYHCSICGKIKDEYIEFDDL